MKPEGKPSPKRGRHTLYGRRMVQRGLAMPADLWAELDAIAAVEGISSSEATRTVVREGLAARAKSAVAPRPVPVT